MALWPLIQGARLNGPHVRVRLKRAVRRTAESGYNTRISIPHPVITALEVELTQPKLFSNYLTSALSWLVNVQRRLARREEESNWLVPNTVNTCCVPLEGTQSLLKKREGDYPCLKQTSIMETSEVCSSFSRKSWHKVLVTSHLPQRRGPVSLPQTFITYQTRSCIPELPSIIQLW
jgi:hypothetical protein